MNKKFLDVFEIPLCLRAQQAILLLH